MPTAVCLNTSNPNRVSQIEIFLRNDTLKFKDVLIQAIAGRANIDGRPYDGSAAEAATLISKLLGEPERVIWCLHDEAPIKPWRINTTAATEMLERETRSKVVALPPVTSYELF